jgi:hypothetical protein
MGRATVEHVHTCSIAVDGKCFLIFALFTGLLLTIMVYGFREGLR